MKKVEIYLESSALWNLYYEEKEAELIEYCLENINISCSSSQWSLLELQRGIQKRVNQHELGKKEAENLEIFIETDIQRLVKKKELILQPITAKLITKTRENIPKYNLYASDALHLTTAIQNNNKVMIVDDYHFKRLDKRIKEEQKIEIIPTAMKHIEFVEMIKFL